MTPILLLSILSPLIPLITGLKRRMTLLWLYCLTGFLFEIIVSCFKRVLHINYLVPSNLYLFIELLFVSFLFKRLIFRSNARFYFVLTVAGLYFVASTIYNSVFVLNHVGASVLSLTYIVFALTGLYTILREQRVAYLEEYWLFWLSIAFVVYPSGNLLIFLFRSFLIDQHYELYRTLWFYLFLVLNVLKNVLLAIALYRYQPEHDGRPS